jgi:hypothetical protein
MLTPPSEDGGFVYIAVNPAWPGRVKVGKTRTPAKRLASYQTATPYRDYEFAAAVWFEDHHFAERLLLRRLNTTNEWAAVDSHFAVKALHALKEEMHGRRDDTRLSG